MANIVEQWFPQHFQKSDDERLMDNILLTMEFWHMSRQEFDELTIPEYMIMRDHALKVLNEQQKIMDKFNLKMKGR